MTQLREHLEQLAEVSALHKVKAKPKHLQVWLQKQAKDKKNLKPKGANDLASTLWNKMAYGDKSKSKPKPKLSDSSSAFDKGLKAAQSKPNVLAAKSGTEARDKARQMGLEYYGFGYWGRNDKVLYHTEGGELKPVNSKHYVVTAQKKHAHKKSPAFLRLGHLMSLVG